MVPPASAVTISSSDSISCGGTTHRETRTFNISYFPSYISLNGGGSSLQIQVPSTDSSGRAIKSIKVRFYYGNGDTKQTDITPGTYWATSTMYVNCSVSSVGTSGSNSFMDSNWNDIFPGDTTASFSSGLQWDSTNYYDDSTPPTITAPNQTITMAQAQTWTPMDGVTA